MKTVLAATRTLFPVAGRAPAVPQRPRERGGMLGAILPIVFAATPLVLLIEAIAQTA